MGEFNSVNHSPPGMKFKPMITGLVICCLMVRTVMSSQAADLRNMQAALRKKIQSGGKLDLDDLAGYFDQVANVPEIRQVYDADSDFDLERWETERSIRSNASDRLATLRS